MKFNKTFKIFSVAVFICGLIAVIVSLNRNSAQTRLPQNVSPSFKVIYSQTFTPSGSSQSENHARTVRLQRADGSWKETVVYFGAGGAEVSTVVKYAVNGSGLFVVDEKAAQLRFHSPRSEVTRAFSEEGFRKGPNYVGEGLVLGYRTLIERVPQDEKEYAEYHHAPELNGLMVKMISVTARGTTLIEATEIQINGFSDEDYGSLPNYPVVYDDYKKSIAATENAGRKDIADQMRKNLPE